MPKAKDPCKNCGHGRKYHVMNKSHMEFLRCEHGGIDTPLCRCKGYNQTHYSTKRSKKNA